MKIYVMDAFAAKLFGGNQAGVALPEGDVSDETMRLIAAELKHSETAFVRLREDGTIGDEDSGVLLEPDTVVSMNFWGFMPSVFDEMERYFEDFLRHDAGENVKTECLLPNMVGELLQEGRLKVSVQQSRDRWFGMTYHEDRARVAGELQKLHEAGVYPQKLR